MLQEVFCLFVLRMITSCSSIFNNYSLKSRGIVEEYLNILPLFTEIKKNNCFSIYTGSDPATTFSEGNH